MMDWNEGWGMGSWGMGGWLFMGLGMILFWGLVAFGLVMLLLALKLVPAAGSSVVERAREAGEAV